jgi:virulence-associated protein VagC
MGKTVSVKVSQQGVLVPRSLVAGWDEVQEVDIEQRADALIIRPRRAETERLNAEIRQEMKAMGLVEDLPWDQPPVVPAAERTRLARKLGAGQPLSEAIIRERDTRL